MYGARDWVIASFRSAISISPPYEMFCWARVDTTTSSDSVMGTGSTTEDSRSLILFAGTVAGDHVQFLTRVAGVAQGSATSVGSFSSGVWYPVSGWEFDASLRGVKFNGEAEVLDTNTVTVMPTVTRFITGAGFSNNAVTGSMNGKTSVPTLWSVNLTTAERDALHAGEHPWNIRPDKIVEMFDLVRPASEKGNTLTQAITTSANLVEIAGGPKVYPSSGRNFFVPRAFIVPAITAFDIDPASPVEVGETVTVTVTATGDVDTITVDMDDGGSAVDLTLASGVPDSTFFWTVAGTVTPVATATGPAGSDDDTHSDYVVEEALDPPVIDSFEVDPATTPALSPVTITYTLSGGSPSEVTADMNGDGIPDLTLTVSPTEYSYGEEGGPYTATLTATNAAGSDTETFEPIVVTEAVDPDPHPPGAFEGVEGLYPGVFAGVL